MEFSAHKGTTSISLVRDALQGAELRGLDVATVLSHAHIDPRLLDQRYARVPAGTFSRLWIALADLLDDEFFAADSHPLRRGSFKLMAQLALGCDTIGQALKRILAFLRTALMTSMGRWSATESMLQLSSMIMVSREGRFVMVPGWSSCTVCFVGCATGASLF